MNRHSTDDLRPTLLALTDPIIRAARLVLVLDERQPDVLRAEAITMSAERLCWTLTQLDGGLSLAVCQALVRALRLGRGRRPVMEPAEATSAELAATAAADWMRRHWLGLSRLPDLVYWLVATDADVRVARHADGTDPMPPPGQRSRSSATHDSASSSPPLTCSWLDSPPIIGPLPGTAMDAPMAWPIRTLITAIHHLIHHSHLRRTTA